MSYPMFEEYPPDQEPVPLLDALGHDSDKPDGHVQRIRAIHRAKSSRERLRRPAFSASTSRLVGYAAALTLLLLLKIAGMEGPELLTLARLVLGAAGGPTVP